MSNPKAAYIATVYSHLSVFHIPFMKMLKSQGFDVHAYANPDHCKSDVENASIECHDIPFSRNPFSFQNVKAMKQLIRRFKDEQYDLIHVHTPNASVVCRIAARLAGCKNVIYTAHGFHFFKGAPLLNWLVYYPVEWVLSRWTDVIIAINCEDYERVRKFPVRNKAVYIPGVGVDVKAYQHIEKYKTDIIRKELGVNGDEFVVLSVAELNSNKNHEQFIYALYTMTKQGIPVVGLIAGVGSRESILKSLVRELNLEKYVKFLGFRKDIPELMNISDVLVLMSQREGLPKVLLEAIAAGKSMVVTDVRGNRELVASGDNGFIVPIGDVAGTAKALTTLYLDPTQRDKMGKNSLNRANTYDIKNIIDELKKLYQDEIQVPVHIPQVSINT